MFLREISFPELWEHMVQSIFSNFTELSLFLWSVCQVFLTHLIFGIYETTLSASFAVNVFVHWFLALLSSYVWYMGFWRDEKTVIHCHLLRITLCKKTFKSVSVKLLSSLYEETICGKRSKCLVSWVKCSLLNSGCSCVLFSPHVFKLFVFTKFDVLARKIKVSLFKSSYQQLRPASL